MNSCPASPGKGLDRRLEAFGNLSRQEIASARLELPLLMLAGAVLRLAGGACLRACPARLRRVVRGVLAYGVVPEILEAIRSDVGSAENLIPKCRICFERIAELPC